MAKRNIIRQIAENRGISEADLISQELSKAGNQKGIAESLGISQAAVSEAMKRLGFYSVVVWKRKPRNADENAPENQAALDEFFAQLAQVESEVSA